MKKLCSALTITLVLVSLAACSSSRNYDSSHRSDSASSKENAKRITNWSSGSKMGAILNTPRGQGAPGFTRSEPQSTYAPEVNPYMCKGEECTCGAGEE